MKRLLGRVDVMELERCHAAVVAADRATPTRLTDEDLLDLPPSAGDGFDSALKAAQVTAAINAVLGAAVDRTRGDEPAVLGDSHDVARPAAGLAVERNAVRPQPIPHRGRAAIQARRHLADRQALFDQRFERGSLQSAPRCG